MNQTFASDVTNRINELLSSVRFSHHLSREFVEPVRELAQGGKRTRALFVAAGWEAAGGEDPLPLHAGTAVELYQLSALVHDDLIDHATTRRGTDASHVGFAKIHARESMRGIADEFGTAATIVLGDYLLSLAMEEMAVAEAVSDEARSAGMRLFATMTAETAFGQYLDIRAENVPLSPDVEEATDSALAVLLHKSARYSVESPLLLGATLRGADHATLTALSKVGLPLGEAFQLRDDDLGIFGKPELTGKPVGSDWSEGKRTVLLALTRAGLDVSNLANADALLGSPLDAQQARRVQELVEKSGARELHERMITRREDAALEAAEHIDTPILHSLIYQLIGRDS
ncbi:geranylgeranyl diphosphate synthase type I [Arcanobacterium wilhelmae]|uniref:Geranylgeranyl diphosphate synthase type I n=1 Tax=Arcanobacterium wilhelmae TaxID=1803177 RepID=A0ABT9N8Z1_9ACTO|nr:polyprenyl synthetase family protein [Arcanobacterium wilhelmae]MDP9800170.1 geranylgeranyl diphosphate synthase type I [Arcanobacterium wilhelmae]WFN89610.1 polyprenyl synthetase family protein [Arcanobacterium wilhelmae]